MGIKRHRTTVDKVEAEKVTIKKRIRWIDTYKNQLEMKEVAVSNATLDRLSEELVRRAQSKSAFCITEFYVSRGIAPQVWERFMNRYPPLQEAYDIAKEIVGIKRETGVAEGRYREAMIKQVHGHYSTIWASEQKRTASLYQGKPSFVGIVEIPAVASTNEVPECITSGEKS